MKYSLFFLLTLGMAGCGKTSPTRTPFPAENVEWHMRKSLQIWDQGGNRWRNVPTAICYGYTGAMCEETYPLGADYYDSFKLDDVRAIRHLGGVR